MSRSRRASREQASPETLREKRIWTAGRGGAGTGWLLAFSLFGYALVTVATRYGLVRAFGALFEAWGIDAANVHRAPAWARALYVWHGSLATLAFAGLSLILAKGLRRLWRLEGPLLGAPSARLWKASLAGLLASALVAALCLLPDSMRLEWPLSAPRFSRTLPAMAAVSLLSTIAGEAFGKRVLYEGLRQRWSAPWATAVVCAVFWLTEGGPGAGVVGGVNALLLGLAGCLLYDRYGFWTSVGFRWSWGFANAFLLGFGGGDAAVYRLYSVSEALMTGGDAGPMCGLWATLLLAVMILVLIKGWHNMARERRAHA